MTVIDAHEHTTHDSTEVDPARLLTPEDIAELLQVDRETVYRMARRGDLPAIKVARHWRFRAAGIDRWLQQLERAEPTRGH